MTYGDTECEGIGERQVFRIRYHVQHDSIEKTDHQLFAHSWTRGATDVAAKSPIRLRTIWTDKMTTTLRGSDVEDV